VGYAPSGTSLLAARVARTIKPGIHAYLMRNHGVVCVGKGADEATRRVAALESECSAFFQGRASDESTALDSSVRALVIAALQSAVSDEIQEAER
jgi:L-fuculose-phosphate aldolase